MDVFFKLLIQFYIFFIKSKPNKSFMTNQKWRSWPVEQWHIQSDYLHANYADSQSALIFGAYLARFVDFIYSSGDKIA